MKHSVFRAFRSILKGAAGAIAILVLAGCSQNLVFDNEYDPRAENSPLSTPVTGVYTFDYIDPTDGKSVDFGWNRIPQALAYEYEVVQLYWRDETGVEAFQLVASGQRGLVATDGLDQPLEGNPSDSRASDDGMYAIRVRYQAQATNIGETNVVWSPWSSPEEREVGVPRYYWRTDDLFRGDQFAGWFDFRGDIYIFQVDFVGQGAAGNTMFLYIDDEFSGYENGADPYIEVYDAENSFDGPFFQGDFNFNKMERPIEFTMPPSERLFIMLESDNPEDTYFEIRIEY